MNGGNQSMESLKTEAPADKNIMQAFNTKKLCDCSDNEIDRAIIPAVSEAFFYIGKRDTPSISGDLKFIYDNLPGELKRILPALRLGEIPIAFKRGLLKEFGEYFGLNVAELLRFCKSHYESEQRINAAKTILKPIQAPQLAPSKESLFYLYKNNLLDAFEKNKVGGNYESNGPGLYDFCNKLGLIIFSTKEKYDIMQDAAHAVIKDQHMALIVIVEDFKRRPLQKIIDVISEHLNNAGPLTEGIKPLIISKSKFLTLKAFFSDIDMSELNLSEIVDNKKDLFINEA